MKCSQADCLEETPDHRFGKIRAAEAGWFFGRDNESAWCPAHVPAWVAGWRARQQAKKAASSG